MGSISCVVTSVRSSPDQMSEEAPESTRKKRKADHPADEGELGPSRKASKHESEDASQELVASQESPSQAKRPWRSVKEARRTHKERVRARKAR